MKFIKGMIAGMMISAGAAFACAEYCMGTSSKLPKKFKKLLK